MRVLHLMKASVWETEKDKPFVGQTYLDTEGFIRCRTPEAFAPVAAQYACRIEPFVLLVIDTGLLTCPIRWEGASARLYGAVDRAAVTDALPFRKHRDGSWRVPEQLLTARE